jgi:DNA repair exonuclease SbcCD ATPase subunit
VLKEKYENQARQLQDEINQLAAECAGTRQSVDHAEDEIEEVKAKSRLRDRHKLLVWLGGDREICARAGSLRRETRRGVRRIRRGGLRLAAKENEIITVIHNGLKQGDENYRRILARQDKGKKARESCSTMLKLAGAARSRLDEAVTSALPHFRDQASRSAADMDVSEVSDRIRAVRSHAADLNRKVRHYGSLPAAEIRSLGVTLPGSDADYQVRLQGFTAARVVLDSIDKSVEYLLGVIAEQAKNDEEERIRLLRQERARFK